MEVHEAANMFPMDEEALEDLAADIKKHGLRVPVETYDGKIIDGRRRWKACEMAKVEPKTVEVSPDDPVSYVLSINLHRRHLTPSQKAMVAARVRYFYDRQARERMVDGGRVGGESKGMENFPYPSTENTLTARDAAGKAVGVSGKSVDHATKVLTKGVPELVAAVDDGRMSVSAAAMLANEPEERQRWQAHMAKGTYTLRIAPDIAEKIEALKAKIGKPHVAHNSGDNEWYTPQSYIESARATMGSIDLDPASSPEANCVVKAETIFTAEQNGLEQDWFGKVWMNPPYAQPECGKFCEKLAASVEAGDVTEALVLVNNATETRWFSRLCSVAVGMCFPAGDVVFAY